MNRCLTMKFRGGWWLFVTCIRINLGSQEVRCGLLKVCAPIELRPTLGLALAYLSIFPTSGNRALGGNQKPMLRVRRFLITDGYA